MHLTDEEFLKKFENILSDTITGLVVPNLPDEQISKKIGEFKSLTSKLFVDKIAELRSSSNLSDTERNIKVTQLDSSIKRIFINKLVETGKTLCQEGHTRLRRSLEPLIPSSNGKTGDKQGCCG